MNKSFISLICFAVLISAPFAKAQLEPVKVPFSFGKMYAPQGFDSNDMVQIVGEGMFKNSCYRYAQSAMKINEAQKTVSIEATAYEYSGFCLQVLVPFERTVDIGILKPGKWEFVQANTANRLGVVEVSTAIKESADDYLYAPVSQAFFQQVNGKNEVLLSGEFTNSCLSVEEVKVSVQPEALVIQPIAKLAETTDCKNGKFPFSKTITVGAMESGKYLLHVRSMNGNAVNSIVSVKALE